MRGKYNSHFLNKNRSHQEKDAEKLVAKKDSRISMACFYFENILNTSLSGAGAVYYKRKLNVYNFTIFDVGAQSGFCYYVWSENEAKKRLEQIS